MTSEVQDIFAKACDLEPAKRDQFVCDECGNNEALRAEVESLLAAHESAGEFMIGPTLDSDPDLQNVVAMGRLISGDFRPDRRPGDVIEITIQDNHIAGVGRCGAPPHDPNLRYQVYIDGQPYLIWPDERMLL